MLKARGLAWYFRYRPVDQGHALPFRRELALTVCCQEGGRQTIGSQTQASLAASTGIEYQRDSALILCAALVKCLVLDERLAYEVAEGAADVPAHILGINIDLAHQFEHFILVGGAGLGARGGEGEGYLVGIVVWIRGVGGSGCVGGGGEGEGVGDLQLRADLKANKAAGRWSGEGGGAVLDYAHHHQC